MYDDYLLVWRKQVATQKAPDLEERKYIYLRQTQRQRIEGMVLAMANEVKTKNSLFSLDMITYSYESQDIIQFALKSAVK
jgi:hypothetical protein